MPTKQIKNMFYLSSFNSGLDVHREYPDLSSLVSVLGPFSFEEARQGFHQLWCEMWDLDPQTDLRESDSAFFRSQYFRRNDGLLGFDDELLDRHGCPDHVHRGA
jgi:hypothetical protein